MNKCPHYKPPRLLVDPLTDKTYEGSAMCETSDKYCLLEYGNGPCGIWEEIKAEWEKEAPRQKTLGDVLIETANKLRGSR